jgi:hypothetical protein
MDQPTLISVRFKTARSGQCGCHLVGIDYSVPPAFARQVVEVEGVAEYVEGDAPSDVDESPRPARRKR